ncbi:MAG: hypothetical protein SOU05_06750 [Atopobium sp.]|uniref:hypothetical protein n=1 Tax=Atopobium sp. TaxID=1872650 RepID=UPI002A74F071|nr:hypothetical protein [Atopobium sp.]MDY2789083.1 hypothetical protein [Atopobium sp.]
MNPKKSTIVVGSLLFLIPVVALLVATVLFVSILTGNLPNWSWVTFGTSYCIAYALAAICLIILPTRKAAMSFATKHAGDDKKKFDLFMGLFLNTSICIFVGFFMSLINVVFINHGPFIGAIMSFLTTFIPVWIVGFVAAGIIMNPAMALSAKLTGDCAPTQN